MEFRVLGPMEAKDGAATVPAGGGRSQAVLAVLLLHANKTVSRSRLIELVWAHAPDSVDSNLRSYLAKLRKALHATGEKHSRLVSDRHGFRIVVYDGELDLAEFDKYADQGESAMRIGDADAARRCFDTALAQWRGAALTGALIEPGLAAAVAHLEERRHQVELRAMEARMALGQHVELVGELRALVAAQPMREHLVGLLMLALYRSGRQRDALDQYQATRQRLVEDLGVDPGSHLEGLYRRILNADPELDAPVPVKAVEDPHGAARVVPSQLPADIPVFTGRDTELAGLLAQARACGQPGDIGPAVVATLDGMAGVGKTTLAVHTARLLAPEFPDGQLFLDLHGFSGSVAAVDPAEALDRMLLALGVADSAIPEHLEDRAALYRSVLAERRVLIVLDNAAGDDQVKPLLPGGSSCFVIVTSRRHLPALDQARAIPVGVLSRNEAIALFMDGAAVTPSPQDEATIADIVHACGCLPLAVRIAAARLRSRPQWTLEDIRVKLTGDGTSLTHLEMGQRSVVAAFDMSYEDLNDEHKRLFRLLGLVPGSQFGLDTVCAMLGESRPARVETRLESLVDAHLLESPRPGRYAFHDLLRAYAVDLCESWESPESRDAVIDRMITHYLNTALRAAEALRMRPIITVADPDPDTPEFADHHAALAWFGEEYHTLRRLIVLTAELQRHKCTCALGQTMDLYFSRRGLWRDWVATGRTVAKSAARLDNPAVLARVHRQVARPLTQLGRYAEAEEHVDQAYELFLRADDYAGLGDVHRVRGWLLTKQHRYREALDHSYAALEALRKAGELRPQAGTLNAIGWRHALLGEYEAAREYCLAGLDVLREAAALDGLTDFQTEAETLDSLGYIHFSQGDHEAAIECYHKALRLLDSHGERYFYTEVLTRLGEVHEFAGEWHIARDMWQQAISILDELGHSGAAVVRGKLATLESKT